MSFKRQANTGTHPLLISLSRVLDSMSSGSDGQGDRHIATRQLAAALVGIELMYFALIVDFGIARRFSGQV